MNDIDVRNIFAKNSIVTESGTFAEKKSSLSFTDETLTILKRKVGLVRPVGTFKWGCPSQGKDRHSRGA